MDNLDEVTSVIKDLLSRVTPTEDKLELPVSTPTVTEINSLARKSLWAALNSGKTDIGTAKYIQVCNSVVSWTDNEQ